MKLTHLQICNQYLTLDTYSSIETASLSSCNSYCLLPLTYALLRTSETFNIRSLIRDALQPTPLRRTLRTYISHPQGSTTRNMQTAGDIPMIIRSENSSSERRITPSWTIGQLKAKLVPVTGIPSLEQKLTLWINNQQSVDIQAHDEENTQLSTFPLAPQAVIHVSSENSL